MKNKIFIACDTTNLKQIKKIIKYSQTKELKFGYKFGLEFLNSKHGRKFAASLKNKITFGDYKIADIPNTCASTILAIKDLKVKLCNNSYWLGSKSFESCKKSFWWNKINWSHCANFS